MARLPAALLCALCCIFVAERGAGQAQKAQGASSVPTSSVRNIDVLPGSGHLKITVAMSTAITPTTSRASNPDRLIFDFAGCELKGGNRRIAVNSGPVKELRASQFSAHPAVTRVVLESVEPLNFEVKTPASGSVVIEIPLRAPATATPVTGTGSREAEKPTIAISPTVKPTEPPNGPQSAQREFKPKRANSLLGAYALMERARGLGLDDLQSLEDKAKSGNPEAQTLLALAYHAGVLLKRDDAEAARLLHQAADRSYPGAEESLGIFAETGIGLDHPSSTEALNWYKKAAQQGSIDAATDIALLYANGKGVPRDPEQAVQWFQRAAEGGDASAQYNLALMYMRAEGVPRDYREAIRWLDAAADQNLVPPILALAEIYLQPPNPSIAVDVNKGMQYYQKAASLGSAVAEVALGTMYTKGMTGKIDYDQAVGWYKKAAAQGEPDGEFALGVSYAMGHGVPVDYAEARRWLTPAANQGQIEAQYDLAIICEQGNGAPPDHEMAAHYYQLAADRGMAKAQYRFGMMLAKGSSSSDRVASYKWLALSQDSIKESAGELSKVKKSMTAQEIAQAEGQITSWKSAHGGGKH
ncbi:MAG TPA: AMIN domain-containing protein [Terriglobales bacterium]|nr:AMIN domain-containing protein [Terriglobales bacterium]